MNYFYAACIAIIALFIVLILQKRNKKVSDYLLIAINISIALFMLSDVLVRKEINSLHVSLQNFIPLLLFGLVIQYIMQFTHSGREKPFYRNLVFLPAFAFLVIAIPDHFILDNYDTSAKIEDHFHTPSITYQFIFKGSQIFSLQCLYTWTGN